MCTEILNHNGTWTILGIVIGFGFAELSAIIKKCKERKDCKNALIDEVRFNQEQTKNKISILDQIINTLQKGQFLSTQCATYSTIEFDNLYHTELSDRQVYKKIKKLSYRYFRIFSIC
ncbi:MAG: hypothetical protein SRB1_02697 [Desulfobacteraceae bacterium Eth-SRB1]|nr:MAG: hypothetical protein SRB1_02697 [Desulfobacteraceae bacterium Eth-SRB1]